MLEVFRPMTPALDWSQSMQAIRPNALALAASATDGDLAAHLAELANNDQLVEFLDQTQNAVQLAQADPAFAETLDPLLNRIRDALTELPTDNLSFSEREAIANTQTVLDDYFGSIDEPPVDEVPGGGLEAHEAAGSHLIERHVGKTEAELIDRLEQEGISASSSFKDLPSAEHFVAETIIENQRAVDGWLDGQGGSRLVIDARFDASTGISVQRGQAHAQDVYTVKLVLERSDALGIGYRIVTGYPTAP